MPYVYFTIDIAADGPFNLGKILTAAASNSITGLTIRNAPQKDISNQYITVQHSPRSAANVIGLADNNSLVVNADGGNYATDFYARLLRRGEVEPLFPTMGNSIHPQDWWINSDINGAIICLFWQLY